jgi:hypothetical protein
MVVDRGMITSARVAAPGSLGAMSWITCLRAPAIRVPTEKGALQLSLLDETTLAEICLRDHPKERLVAGRNPALAQERSRKRSEQLDATEAKLAKIAESVRSGRLKGADKIGVRVGRVANRYKMDKRFEIMTAENNFGFSRCHGEIAAETFLDDICIFATNEEASRLDALGAATAYTGRPVVERTFRSIKAIDLDLGPIYQISEDRARAHVFICKLGAYVVSHLRRAWAPLCFTDEKPLSREDPVAPVPLSCSAKGADARKLTATDDTVHNLSSLFDHLATLTRDSIVFTGGVRIEKLMLATPPECRAFELIGAPIPTKPGPMQTERSSRPHENLLDVRS